MRQVRANLKTVIPRTRTQRATTWLSLAAALLIALMPAAGVMVCLGKGGHVVLGAVGETGSCPCAQEASTDAEQPTNPVRTEGRHPPCADIALRLFGAIKDTGVAPKLAKSANIPPDDHPPAIANWWSDGSSPPRAELASRPRMTPRPALLRQQLENRRTVVLLI